jgi:hypothetical protein
MENLVRSMAPIKMNNGWFRYFRDELKTFKPMCHYCGGFCHKGSYADYFFPYCDRTSYHKNCLHKAQVNPK